MLSGLLIVRVSLFVTCLVDQFWPEVGRATVELLRRAGCTVDFVPEQTCCSQPGFNAGLHDSARAVARHLIETYEADDAPIVVPSGSCTAMFHHLTTLFSDEPGWRARAERVAGRVHELGTFLLDVLGIDDHGARFEGRVTWHDACHGLRELGIRAGPRRLLGKVAGVELVEAKTCDSCCGFGGTFSVQYPEISVAMLDEKIADLEGLGVDAVVSGDVSCLMQIDGRLRKRGSSIAVLHLAELLNSR